MEKNYGELGEIRFFDIFFSEICKSESFTITVKQNSPENFSLYIKIVYKCKKDLTTMKRRNLHHKKLLKVESF